MLSKKFRRQWPLHLMILPGIVIVLIYSYWPMIGIAMAFQKFVPFKGLFGSDWIGLDNFRYVFDLPETGQIIWNTVFIAFMKIHRGSWSCRSWFRCC